MASHNAGVTVVIVGISNNGGKIRRLFSAVDNGEVISKEADNINAYLVAALNTFVSSRTDTISQFHAMQKGNQPTDGGNLSLGSSEKRNLLEKYPDLRELIHIYIGSKEFIRGEQRYCFWIKEEDLDKARSFPEVVQRLDRVREMRQASTKATTVALGAQPHRFDEIRQVGDEAILVIPSVSSEGRDYLPVGYLPPGTIVSNLAFFVGNPPLWNMALIASRTHLVWIATVCGKLKTDFRYSNTLGWNTFPLPKLTEKNKKDLTHCAEDILLAREAHFPATIADLYKPEEIGRAHV